KKDWHHELGRGTREVGGSRPGPARPRRRAWPGRVRRDRRRARTAEVLGPRPAEYGRSKGIPDLRSGDPALPARHPDLAARPLPPRDRGSANPDEAGDGPAGEADRRDGPAGRARWRLRRVPGRGRIAAPDETDLPRRHPPAGPHERDRQVAPDRA